MCILVRFFGFWEPTWLQNGVKLGIKNALLLSLIEKGEHPKNTYFSNRILIILGFGWSKIEAKIDQKSIKTRPQHGKASWHRFFDDFRGFCDPSWVPKWCRNRLSIITFFECQNHKIYHRGGVGGGGDRIVRGRPPPVAGGGKGVGNDNIFSKGVLTRQ